MFQNGAATMFQSSEYFFEGGTFFFLRVLYVWHLQESIEPNVHVLPITQKDLGRPCNYEAPRKGFSKVRECLALT